jgi:hypothetical protein
MDERRRQARLPLDACLLAAAAVLVLAIVAGLLRYSRAPEPARHVARLLIAGSGQLFVEGHDATIYSQRET